MSKIFNITNIYLGLWCAFNITFATSNMISRPLFVVIAVITLYYMVFEFNSYRSSIYMKGLIILLIMFFVYGIELISSGKVYYIEFVNKKENNLVYLITVFKSLGPIIPFYVLTKQGKITQKTLTIWVPIFLITTVFTYFLTYEKMLIESLSNSKNFVNNQGYMFASILPLVFFVDKKSWVKYIYSAVIMAFVFMSMKRGAFIIGSVCFLYYLYHQIKLSSGKQKPIVIITVLLILLISFVVLIKYYFSNSFFANRILETLEGNSSHRDEIYSFLWDYYKTKTSFLQQIIGCGANYTLSISENYAHNDWLELLINNGLLGVLFYLNYWIKSFRQYFLTINPVVKYAFGCAIVFAFAKSFISMSYGDIGSYLALCIGFCVATSDIEK